MPADFATAAKAARVQIPVPALDITAIRERAAAGAIRERTRRLIVALTAALGVIGGAAAFAGIGGGVHLWLSGKGVRAIVESFTTVRNPMAADVQRVVSRATFPVILPPGIPRGAYGMWIAYSPADKPDMFTIQYQGSSGKPYASVTIVDNAKIRRDIGEMPAGPPQAVVTKGVHWQIGGETVIVQSRHLSDADVAGIQSAMRSETVAESQAAFEAALPKIVIMQVPPRIAAAAERFAPRGRNVLFGKWDIHQIPVLAAKGRPLRDSRTVNITNIPQVHGAPDYRHATLQWPKSIAIPPGGVRAVAAALRRTGTGPACGCAILVHQAADAYTVWKIDAKTLKVTRL